MKDKEETIWEENSFFESLSSEDFKVREKTFHKKHDEDLNFDCKKCNKKISAHNKDWHKGLCDGCFNKEVYGKE